MPGPSPQTPSPPNAFQLLPTGEAGLAAMLSAIEAAESSVDFEVYIFSADAVGVRFREALVAARRRGARVRVLVDAFGSMGLPAAFWSPLAALGGEFRWFNPFRAAERYGQRNHRKLLVVDGRTAIIGGFNIGGEYNGDGVRRGWRDLGLAVRDATGADALLAALSRSFEAIFTHARNLPHWVERLPRLARLPLAPNPAIQTPAATLHFCAPGSSRRSFKQSLLRDLRRAKAVSLICGYFLPTWRIRRALIRIARGGGCVRLILPGRSDHPVARLAGQNLYARLLRAGVEIYEYRPQVLHAKLCILDDAVYVGSANLDTRSLNINYELMLRVADPAVAEQARGLFEGDLAHCRKVDAAAWGGSRSWLTRLMEKLAYFLIARLDPFLTTLRWRERAHDALARQARE